MLKRLSADVSAQDHIEGSQNAGVTLVEYGDFECPYSAEAVTTVQAIQVRLGENFRFVYRHFPLTHKHPHAFRAAEASEAAAHQHQFWKMYRLLFARQDALSESDLLRYASALYLDVEQFQRELTSRSHAGRVQRDMQQGERSGVTGTPTFFLNGVLYSGDDSFEALLKAIEARH